MVGGDSEAGGGDCRKNLTYVITSPVFCVRKQKEDKTAREPARYLGETADIAQERGQDHLEGVQHSSVREKKKVL